MGWRDFGRWTAAESRSIITKEILKYILFTGLAVVGGWILAAASELFHLQKPLTYEALKDRFVGLAKLLWADPYSYTIGYFGRDPAHAIASLVLATCFLILLILFRRARKQLREQSQILNAAAADSALVHQAGLGGRWPHARVGEPNGAPWEAIRAEILGAHNHILWILGANGIDTFGKQGSPLYETLQEFQGSVQVVLVSTKSSEVVGRANAVGIDPGEYREAIRTSVRRLRDLHRQQHNIEGRYYDGQLNWKLIITSRTVWMQYYMPGNKHVDQTPAWRFDLTTEPGCLYHYFHMEFGRVWRRCGGDEMDLK